MTHNTEVLSADHDVSLSGQLLLQALHEIVLNGIAVSDTALASVDACAKSLSLAKLKTLKTLKASEKLPGSLTSHLAQALDLAPRINERFECVLDSLGVILPHATWMKREAKPGQENTFVEMHRHAIITGAGGMFECETLTLGMALMAPFTNYPFHHHPPAEFYLVLSQGEWFREDVGWWSPGSGGLVFNPPSSLHAMRSTDAPLLALWGLIH
jgi:hypothetical protein